MVTPGPENLYGKVVSNLDALLDERQAKSIDWEQAFQYILVSGGFSIESIDKSALKRYILDNSRHRDTLKNDWSDCNLHQKVRVHTESNGNSLHEHYFHPVCELLMKAMNYQKNNQVILSILTGLLYRSLKCVNDEDSDINVSYEIEEDSEYHEDAIKTIQNVLSTMKNSANDAWSNTVDIGITTATTLKNQERICIFYFRAKC